MKRRFTGVLLCIVCAALLLASNAQAAGSLNLPSGLAAIEEAAFANDTTITSVDIPSGVKQISTKAFNGCTNLQHVTIHSMDADIADDAFDQSAIQFSVYQSSTAEVYALSRGYQVSYLADNDSFSSLALNLIMDQGKPDSIFMGEVYASKRLLVQAEGTSLPDISAYNPTRIIPEGTGFFVVQFGSMEEAGACDEYLDACSGIDFSEPDSFLTVSMESDNDVSGNALNDNWSNKDPMGLEIYSNYIQKNYPGSSATVAVVDSGVAMHSALNAHVISGYDFSGQNNPRYDAANHGTAVAGCIVDAVFGANVKILPIKISGGEFVTTLMIRQAIKQAIQCKPDVINISSLFEESAAVRSLLERTSIPVVVSAGNSNGSCDTLFPARLGNVITVSSIDSNMTKAAHSNYGSSVDYCAPGANISSYTNTGGVYDDFWGTSYAAPHVSAAIALLAMDPNHDVSALKTVAIDLGNTGYDQYYGWGLPDMSMLADKVRRINITSTVPSVMQVGGSAALIYEVLPDTAADRTVSITCSDNNVLNVTKTADGVLRLVGMAQGTAVVTITANDGSGVSVSTPEIQVVQPVSTIRITAATNTINLAKAGETLGLSYTVMPSDATNKSLVWTSDDETIATVAQNGVVTPVGVGKTMIRATAEDGYGAYGEFEVEVISQSMPTGIDIITDTVVLKVGETMQLGVDIDPDDAVQTVSWNSLNKAVATVNSSGLVTAVSPGKVYIAATSTVDSALMAWRELIVIQPAESLTVTSEGDVHVISAGETLQLIAEVLPANAEDTSVTWETSNELVATVDDTGHVAGIAPGIATITVTANGNTSLTELYQITVYQLPTEIIISGAEDSLYIGNTAQLTAAVMPENAEDKSVVWSSSDDTIATVSATGLVQGIGEGVVTITATSTAVPTLAASVTLNVFPEWYYSDWVLAEDAPSNAIILENKWTYTESTSSTTQLSGDWKLVSESWAPTNTGYVRWVDFSPISGFNKSHSLYSKFNQARPQDSLTATTKRTVTVAPDGYLYWHWMYDCGGSNAYDRAIFYQKGYGSTALTNNNYYYQYFGAFESYTAYTQCNAANNYGQNDAYYLWYYVPDRTDYASSQGSYYWYRSQIYRSTYTDYVKQYNYTREVTVTSKPAESANISNVVHYVKYKEANDPNFQLSEWVSEDSVPADATVVETKWRYTETTTTGNSTLSGWNLTGSEWKQSGSGSVRWADFSNIGGFQKSNSLYALYNKAAPTAYETENAKRVINSSANDGYIYWHWMYDCGGGNAYDRIIFYQNAYGSTALTSNNYYYKYFGAFESYTAYTQCDAGTNRDQNDAYYLWYYVPDRTDYASSQGSYYWYRTQIKKTSYTDYSKLYTFSRTVTTTTEPAESDGITNIEKLVRYIK